MKKLFGAFIGKSLPTLAILAVFLASWVPHNTAWVWWRWWLIFIGKIPLIFISVALAVRFIPPLRKVVALLARLRLTFPISERAWVIGMTLFTLGAATFLSFTVFGNTMCVADESIQYIQARIFAHGELYAKSHTYPEFFNVWRLANRGRYYGMYPPGHSMLIGALIWVGLGGLIGPIMGAAGSALVYYLTKEVASIRAARIATVLLLCSQFYMFMAASYMNHTTGFACAAAFALFYIRMHKRGRKTDALLAGIALGFLLITRPQVAVPLAIPFAVHWLYTRRHTLWKMRNFLCAAILAAIVGLFGAFFLYYNAQTTGNPWVTGYEVLYPANMSASRFKSLWGWWNIHRDLTRTVIHIQQLHLNLFDWPTSSLIFIPALFLLRLPCRYKYLLVAAPISIALSLVLNRYMLPFFPPRYLFEATPFCFVLTAQCIAQLPAWLIRCAKLRLTLAESRQYVLWHLILLFLLALPYKIMTDYRIYSNHYWENNPAYAQKIVQGITHTPALVFYAGPEKYYYLTAMALNGLPPYPDNRIIMARALQSHKNKLMMKLYPDRYVYVVHSNSVRLHRLPLMQGNFLPLVH